MKYTYKSLLTFAGITGIAVTSSASAFFPMQNAMLQNQMARQNTINTINAKNNIINQNRNHLKKLREARQKQNQKKTVSRVTRNNIKFLLFWPVKTISPSIALQPKAKKVQTPRIQKIKKPLFTAPKKTQKITHTPSYSRERNLRNVDINRVRNTWLAWNNGLRREMGLHPYTLRNELNNTALEFSQFSKNRGYIMHGRGGSDWCRGSGNYGCYNFKAIDVWFKNRGINPKIINRSKHTENLGWGYYKCNKSDCTDALIKSIRKTYNFFYSEKPYNGSHYRSMTNKYFKWIGVDVVVDPAKNRYYLTIHYANDF